VVFDKLGQVVVIHLCLCYYAVLFVQLMSPQLLKCQCECVRICGDLFRRSRFLTFYAGECIEKLFLVRGRVHCRLVERFAKTLP
jgi:hypothetical protein